MTQEKPILNPGYPGEIAGCQQLSIKPGKREQNLTPGVSSLTMNYGWMLFLKLVSIQSFILSEIAHQMKYSPGTTFIPGLKNRFYFKTINGARQKKSEWIAVVIVSLAEFCQYIMTFAIKTQALFGFVQK